MKRIYVGLLVLALGLGLAGCGGQSGTTPPATSPDTQAQESGPKYTIAVIPKGLGHQFWSTVQAGAEAAAKEYDAKILWNGPAKETQIQEQINIVQDMVTRKVDGIVMAACDENALVDSIANAMDKGIPVATIDSGVKSDLPISFVATDNVAGAKAAADTLVELIGGEGNVGLIPFVPGAATSELREQGFKDGLQAHENVALVSTIYCNSDVSKAMNAMQEMMTSHPDIKGVFAANEPACLGASRALESAGKDGQVKLVAFDASPDQVEALEKGSVQALIVQNPFRMGYEGVKSVIDHIEGRPVEKRIDTGVTVVTKENLNTPEVQKLINP